MNKIILLILLVSLMGCSTAPEKGYEESNAQKRLKGCVLDFLDRDVGPSLGIDVCGKIYKRYDKETP